MAKPASYLFPLIDDSPLRDFQPLTSRKKQPQLVESLVHLVRQLGPGARLPRVKAMTEALGVSLATLDVGLKQLEQRGLIERRSTSGIYATDCILQKTIGLTFAADIFSRSSTSFYSMLLEQCTNRAASHRERFSFFLNLPNLNRVSTSSMVHHDLMTALSNRSLDGLLVASTRGMDEEEWLRGQGIPTVCLNFGTTPCSVTFDYNELIRIAAKELIIEGCGTLGLIGGIESRSEIFRGMAAKWGFQFREEWIREISDVSVENGALAAESLMNACQSSGLSLPKGLIITNDVIASGVCSYFQSKNIAIGKDLMIATHSNQGSKILEQWNPDLIRCEIEPSEVAEAMFLMLETLMDNRPLPKTVEFISPHLIHRL